MYAPTRNRCGFHVDSQHLALACSFQKPKLEYKQKNHLFSKCRITPKQCSFSASQLCFHRIHSICPYPNFTYSSPNLTYSSPYIFVTCPTFSLTPCNLPNSACNSSIRTLLRLESWAVFLMRSSIFQMSSSYMWHCLESMSSLMRISFISLPSLPSPASRFMVPLRSPPSSFSYFQALLLLSTTFSRFSFTN